MSCEKAPKVHRETQRNSDLPLAADSGGQRQAHNQVLAVLLEEVLEVPEVLASVEERLRARS